MENNQTTIPYQYEPISAWGYFGYSLLFNIPIIGFILLLVFAFDGSNINRRNYARSFFCIYIFIFIVTLIYIVATGLTIATFFTKIRAIIGM